MASYPDPTGSRFLLQRSVQLATQAGDGWCEITAAQCLATTWMWQDEFDVARPILDGACATATRLGYRRAFAWYWFCSGWEATFKGRLEEASESFARAVAASEAGDSLHQWFCQWPLGLRAACLRREQARVFARRQDVPTRAGNRRGAPVWDGPPGAGQCRDGLG